MLSEKGAGHRLGSHHRVQGDVIVGSFAEIHRNIDRKNGSSQHPGLTDRDLGDDASIDKMVTVDLD